MTVTLKITFLKIDISPRKTPIMAGRELGSTSLSPKFHCEHCGYFICKEITVIIV